MPKRPTDAQLYALDVLSRERPAVLSADGQDGGPMFIQKGPETAWYATGGDVAAGTFRVLLERGWIERAPGLDQPYGDHGEHTVEAYTITDAGRAAAEDALQPSARPS